MALGPRTKVNCLAPFNAIFFLFRHRYAPFTSSQMTKAMAKCNLIETAYTVYSRYIPFA